MAWFGRVVTSYLQMPPADEAEIREQIGRFFIRALRPGLS